jgi:hypothetical protein
VGSLPGTSDRRTMTWLYNYRRGGPRDVAHTSTAKALLMDGGAAGAGEAPNVWHARDGSGLAFVADIAPCEVGSGDQELRSLMKGRLSRTMPSW